MSLNTAHEGYEYQDLLTAFFILEEILNENDTIFKIDSKEHSDDKFDDLTIENSHGVFKKQIKYSNELSNHTAIKDDFATSVISNEQSPDFRKRRSPVLGKLKSPI